jgi:hypothetical protein
MKIREVRAKASRHAEIKSNNAVRDIWQSAMMHPIKDYVSDARFLESIKTDEAFKKRINKILANAKR